MGDVWSGRGAWARHPIVAYVHIVPGVVYIILAPFQISTTVRRNSLSRHRMLGRAAALLGLVSALGVATIRVILGLGEAFGVLTFDDSFGVAFWAGFLINALVVELWLRRWPTASPVTRRSRAQAVT